MAGCAWPERDSPAVKRGSLQNGSPVVSSCSAVEAPSCPPVIYRKAGHLIFTIFLFLHSVQMSLEKVTGSLSRHRILPTTLLCTADLTVVCSADRSESLCWQRPLQSYCGWLCHPLSICHSGSPGSLFSPSSPPLQPPASILGFQCLAELHPLLTLPYTAISSCSVSE